MIHCSGAKSTTIGDGVIVDTGATVHGSSIEDGVVIGKGAQVLDGATVGKNAVITAGSLVTQGKNIPSGELWGGVPAGDNIKIQINCEVHSKPLPSSRAVYLRHLTSEELLANSERVVVEFELAVVHAQESLKSWERIEWEEDDQDQREGRSDYYHQRLTEQVS